MQQAAITSVLVAVAEVSRSHKKPLQRPLLADLGSLADPTPPLEGNSVTRSHSAACGALRCEAAQWDIPAPSKKRHRKRAKQFPASKCSLGAAFPGPRPATLLCPSCTHFQE
mmetsp:Transcript_94990/g.306686  ORF Transcript_94990/g.306686 Transcript_94990/m.306686 type:complete len:112 (-) Transcript_94990:165-500(-)